MSEKANTEEQPVDIGYLERWADSLEGAALSQPTSVAEICLEKAKHLRRAIAALKKETV